MLFTRTSKRTTETAGEPIKPDSAEAYGRPPGKPRLSVEECRKALGLRGLSDEEVEEVRDALYGFAHALIQGYLKEKQGSAQKS